MLLLLLSSMLQANSFGPDNRHKWEESVIMPHPLDRVGTLKHPTGTRCTASYIGKGFILTAAHCVMKQGKNQLQKGDYLFEYLQAPDAKFQHTRTIRRFYYQELIQLEDQGIEKAAKHWVILELDSPISSPERYFGYHYPVDDEYDEYHESNYELSIMGFSPMFNGNSNVLTFSDSNCSIQKHLSNSHVALHDCNAGPRDSGSPLYKCDVNEADGWDKCAIYAMHIGAFSTQGTRFSHYSRDNANVAVTVKSFKDTIYFLVMGGLKPYGLKSVNNDSATTFHISSR